MGGGGGGGEEEAAGEGEEEEVVEEVEEEEEEEEGSIFGLECFVYTKTERFLGVSNRQTTTKPRPATLGTDKTLLHEDWQDIRGHPPTRHSHGLTTPSGMHGKCSLDTPMFHTHIQTDHALAKHSLMFHVSADHALRYSGTTPARTPVKHTYRLTTSSLLQGNHLTGALIFHTYSHSSQHIPGRPMFHTDRLRCSDIPHLQPLKPTHTWQANVPHRQTEVL